MGGKKEMSKEYGLHCFNCGELFYDKTEVFRIEGKPYCGECMSGFDYPIDDDYDEEEMIDRANIAKYGEC